MSEIEDTTEATVAPFLELQKKLQDSPVIDSIQFLKDAQKDNK